MEGEKGKVTAGLVWGTGLGNGGDARMSGCGVGARERGPGRVQGGCALGLGALKLPTPTLSLPHLPPPSPAAEIFKGAHHFLAGFIWWTFHYFLGSRV